MTSTPRPVATIAVLLALTSFVRGGDPPSAAVDARWLERLDATDRTLLNELIGHAPPTFTSDLQWIGLEPTDWPAPRGSVVVLQSWTCRSGAGRSWPSRVATTLQTNIDAGEARLIAVHTPEGAEKAEAFLERRPLSGTVVVDSSGEWCDALGVYKRPVNIVVDRQGVVRYAGLNQRGLAEAVKLLVAEPFDESRPAPKPRPAPAATDYPPVRGTVGTARDVRGKRSPDLVVDQWITAKPEADRRVVMIDFWATWCGPCVASIPHVNRLADRFGEDLVIVGLSDERPDKFQAGLQRRELGPSSFHYTLALDPRGRMKRALAVRGIPHAIVMSSDWVVRWQGHPASLNEATVEQIIAANGGGAGADARARWRSRGR